MNQGHEEHDGCAGKMALIVIILIILFVIIGERMFDGWDRFGCAAPRNPSHTTDSR